MTLDLTLYTRAGFHSDTSKTFCLYPPDSKELDSCAIALQEITRLALYQAIEVCGPGVPFREIGRIIERTVERESSGAMSVVKQLTGHGIGRNFHMRPWILHYGEFPSLFRL
jgi:methionyl aminopeptidase